VFNGPAVVTLGRANSAADIRPCSSFHPGRKPDLTIAVSKWPSEAPKDAIVTLPYTISNVGTGWAYTGMKDGFWAGLYLDGEEWTRHDILPLGPGQSYTASFQWKAVCGIHTLQVEADLWDTLTELDEGNSTTPVHKVAVDCAQSLPDLVITPLRWPTTSGEGSLVSLDYRVTNRGNAMADGGYLNRFYVDGAPIPNVDGQSGSRDGGPLGPGESASHRFEWRAACGAHGITVKADALKNHVAEGDESINTATHPMVVSCRQKPDLVIELRSWPNAGTGGEEIRLSYLIRTGAAASTVGKFRVQLYVDGQPLPNEWPDYGSVLHYGIPDSGDASAGDLVWLATRGRRQLSAQADAEAQVEETNEGNNTSPSHSITVECEQ